MKEAREKGDRGWPLTRLTNFVDDRKREVHHDDSSDTQGNSHIKIEADYIRSDIHVYIRTTALDPATLGNQLY